MERRLEANEASWLAAEDVTRQAKARATIKRLVAIDKARLRAVEEYKAFKTFKAEILDGSTSTFTIDAG